MERPLTPAEQERLEEDKVSWETIAEERLWNKRPGGIALRRPRKAKTALFIIFEIYKNVGPYGSVYRGTVCLLQIGPQQDSTTPGMGGSTGELKLHRRSRLTGRGEHTEEPPIFAKQASTRSLS